MLIILGEYVFDIVDSENMKWYQLIILNSLKILTGSFLKSSNSS